MAKQPYILVSECIYTDVNFDSWGSTYKTLQNMLSYVDIIKVQTKAIEQEKTPSESTSKGMPFGNSTP